MILIGSQLVQLASVGHKTLFQWEWTDLDPQSTLRYVTRECTTATQQSSLAFWHVAAAAVLLSAVYVGGHELLSSLLCKSSAL